jgi:phosphate-selective porin
MYRPILLSTICLCLLVFIPVVTAGQTSSTLQELRQKLDAQQVQIDRLTELVKQQTELIDRQQQQVETLEQKLTSQASEATNNTTAAMGTPAVAAADKPATGVATAATATKKSDSSLTFKVSGLLQGWFAAGNNGFRDTFRVRRAELKFTGEITPELKWTVMIDPSKALSMNNTFTTINGTRVLADTSVNQASRILQDAFITYDYSKRIHVSVGQFKLPLSLEGLQSSARLDTVERALFLSDRARGGNYGDVRDVGAMVYGPLTSRVDYQLALFNGGGENQNDVDKNDRKSLSGRLVGRPSFVSGLQVGFSGVWSASNRANLDRRDRLGAEMIFIRGPLTLKSEFMTGADSALHRRGYYGHAGYHLTGKFEPVFRFDYWDPNTRLESDAASVTERDYIAGFNYYIRENRAKFQFNYVRKTFADSIQPARNLLMMNLQTSW